MNENETYEFENRVYANPQTSMDEQQEFIKNYRAAVPRNNAQINTQTYNLGTRVPSGIGGLGGGSTNYFAQRYQTPTVNATVADLNATMQAQALNTALGNLNSQWQKRYNDAYRSYQKRSSNGGGGGGDDGGSQKKLPTDTNPGLSGILDVDEAPTPGAGQLGVDESGRMYVVGNDGKAKTYLLESDIKNEPTQAINGLGTRLDGTLRHKDGDVVNIRGTEYVMVNGKWYIKEK